MSAVTMQTKVEKVLQTFMSANYPAVPIDFANVQFKQPDGSFLRVRILEGRSSNIEIGKASRVRHPGIIQIDVMVKQFTGLRPANTMVDSIEGLYRNQSFTLPDQAYLRFRAPYHQYLGEANGYSRTAVSVPYWRDEMQ